MAGLLDFDPAELSNIQEGELGPQYRPQQFGGLLDMLKAQPVQAAPVKAMVDANPAGMMPTSLGAPKASDLDKQPGWWDRLKTAATTPNEQGFNWGDKLFAAGSIAAGQPELAVNYQNQVRQRATQTKALARQKALSQLFTQSLGPNGRLDPAKWSAGIKALGGDADIGDVSELQKEFGPHPQVINDPRFGGIFSIDPADPKSFQVLHRFAAQPVKIGEGWAIPDTPAGGEEAGEPAAAQTPGEEAAEGAPMPTAGADTLPNAVPAVARGSAQGPPVVGGPTQAAQSFTPNGQRPGTRGPVAYTPADLDAMTRALATEALGEGAPGMAAVGHVILNRAQGGYGGAHSIADVVNAPHQFEGMSRAGQVTPQAYAQAQAVAKQLLAGGGADPTNGATQYLNPELQAQLGRAQPAWATGQGQRIGNHVFYGGAAGGQPQQAAAAPAQGPQAGADTLAGGTAADQVEQPPPGYRWLVPPPSKNVWKDVDKSQSGGWGPGTYQRNSQTGEVREIPGTGKPGGGKLTAGQQTQQNASLYALGTASGINTRFDKSIAALDTGLLKPSLVGNAASSLYNTLGVSTPQSRALANFKANLLRTVNESLRLNKGVQTEGDAQRAAAEIMQNMNDPDIVRQRLLELKDMNSQAIELHKALVNQTRDDAGLPPVDFTKFEAKPLTEREKTAGGQAGTQAPARPTATPQQARVQSAAQPVRVTSPDDVRKLHSGTVFITPDGRRKVAP